MLKQSFIVTVMMVCFYPISLVAETFPFYRAAKVNASPVIDGKLTEECWTAAATTAPFVAIGGAVAEVKTTGMLCWDDENLYLGVVCPEPLMDRLEARVKKGELGAFEESIEIFLDPDYDRTTYFQLRVDITGERDSREGKEISPAIQAGWTAAVHRGADRWTAELAVPFKLLGDSRPKPALIWGLNLNRQRLVDAQGVKWSCWSDTKYGFHEPGLFGNLIFADSAIWLRSYYATQIGAKMDEITDLMMRYPQAAGPLIPEIGRLDTLWVEFLKPLSAPAQEVAGRQAELAAAGDRVVAAYDEYLSKLLQAVIKTAFR